MSEDSPPTLGTNGRILEGIVTTLNVDGSVNIAPMGPLADESVETFVLRPFHDSTTCENLLRTREGVLNVTDDVELFAQAAVGLVDEKFHEDRPLVLADACRWFNFQITSIDASHERVVMVARTIDRGSQRDFFGFNRAKHAVIEAAILATRIHLIPAGEISAEFERLKIIVEKTGAAAEHRAFAFLKAHIR
jgi:hypothetical protein